MAKIDLNDYLEKLTEPEDRETVANRAYQRELFEQYVTKDGNFPEQRAQLLEDFRVGKELTGPKGLRRKLGAFDLEYFGRAYLAHYFVRPSPKFHGELDRIWREGVLKGMNPEVDAKRISRADGCRRAIEAPRGHAKSTTFTFKDDLHAAVYGYKHYIIILSDSSEQAEGFLVDIKTELEENAALKEDFGELEGKVWKSSVILLANGVKIEAIGSGKKIRGRRHKQWRPDLKVLVTPTWKIEGAVAKVEACNNGFDAVPTWEDITAMVQINRVYNFTNKTKTASKWGVNIRFTITKNEGFEGEVSISGFGGAYE